MSERTFPSGGPASLDGLDASCALPAHGHPALRPEALAPGSTLRARSLTTGALRLAAHDVGETLADRATRTEGVVTGPITVEGHTRAAAQRPARAPRLWPAVDRPAVWFSISELGVTNNIVNLPATGPGRLLVLLSFSTATGAGEARPGRLGLQLVVFGPRGGQDEAMIPLNLGELTDDERRDLARAQSFDAWWKARKGSVRGGWLPTDQAEGLYYQSRVLGAPRNASLSTTFPAPGKPARVLLLWDDPYAGIGGNYFLQVVYLPSRAP